MKATDLAELVTLAALWGASFLFMRMGAAEFGPFALAAVRVGGATLLLLPLLVLRGQMPVLRRHWRAIFVVGVTNSAVPFLSFSYAALSISAGLSSIFNAAAPLFGAVVAWLWVKDRPSAARTMGLAIGFGGVVWLAAGNASFKPGGSGGAIVACMIGALFYGISANLTQQRLAGVAPMAVAAGSQFAATLVLMVPAVLFWPEQAPSPTAWLAAGLLAFACTGLAYLLFFRLIAHVGPANAITVTFLIPLFAVVWGGLWLGESLSVSMGIGCAVILVGTCLATGLWAPKLRPA